MTCKAISFGRKDFVSTMKKIYIYEILFDLVECNISWNIRTT